MPTASASGREYLPIASAHWPLASGHLLLVSADLPLAKTDLPLVASQDHLHKRPVISLRDACAFYIDDSGFAVNNRKEETEIEMTSTYGHLQQLATDFWNWRAANQPISSDDIPRIERPHDWVPD